MSRYRGRLGRDVRGGPEQRRGLAVVEAIEELRADPVRWKQAVDEWTSTEASDLRQAIRRRVVDAIESIVPRHPRLARA